MCWDPETIFEIVPLLTREPRLWQQVTILEGTCREHQGWVTATGSQPQHRKRRLKQVMVLKLCLKLMCSESVSNDGPVKGPVKSSLCIQVPLPFPILDCLYVNPVPPALGSKTQLWVSQLGFTLFHLQLIQLQRAIKNSKHFQCFSLSFLEELNHCWHRRKWIALDCS